MLVAAAAGQRTAKAPEIDVSPSGSDPRRTASPDLGSQARGEGEAQDRQENRSV